MKTIRQYIEKTYPGKPFKIIHTFSILHSDWELDNLGWIVQVDNKNILLLTNHNVLYKAHKDEIKKYLSFYKEVMEQTERALILLS